METYKGKPTEYTEELADRICELLVEGNSLNRICKLSDMPRIAVVFKWLREVDGFSAKYTRAREEQADTLADDIMEISDEASVLGDSVAVQAARLRVDARKWVAAKLKPKKYGERVVHAGDEDAPITTKDVTKAEEAALTRFLQNYPDRLKIPSEKTTKEDQENDDDLV